MHLESLCHRKLFRQSCIWYLCIMLEVHTIIPNCSQPCQKIPFGNVSCHAGPTSLRDSKICGQYLEARKTTRTRAQPLSDPCRRFVLDLPIFQGGSFTMRSGSRALLDADTPEDSAPRMVKMTDVEVNAGLLGLQQHMSRLVWLQVKTVHANPC